MACAPKANFMRPQGLRQINQILTTTKQMGHVHHPESACARDKPPKSTREFQVVYAKCRPLGKCHGSIRRGCGRVRAATTNPSAPKWSDQGHSETRLSCENCVSCV